MALNLTAADSALKEDYQPAIREQLNQEIMMLNQIEQNTRDVEGRRLYSQSTLAVTAA